MLSTRYATATPKNPPTTIATALPSDPSDDTGF
jgi:hypothetical protein